MAKQLQNFNFVLNHAEVFSRPADAFDCHRVSGRGVDSVRDGAVGATGFGGINIVASLTVRGAERSRGQARRGDGRGGRGGEKLQDARDVGVAVQVREVEFVAKILDPYASIADESLLRVFQRCGIDGDGVCVGDGEENSGLRMQGKAKMTACDVMRPGR